MIKFFSAGIKSYCTSKGKRAKHCLACLYKCGFLNQNIMNMIMDYIKYYVEKSGKEGQSLQERLMDMVYDICDIYFFMLFILILL